MLRSSEFKGFYSHSSLKVPLRVHSLHFEFKVKEILNLKYCLTIPK